MPDLLCLTKTAAMVLLGLAAGCSAQLPETGQEVNEGRQQTEETVSRRDPVIETASRPPEEMDSGYYRVGSHQYIVSTKGETLETLIPDLAIRFNSPALTYFVILENASGRHLDTSGKVSQEKLEQMLPEHPLYNRFLAHILDEGNHPIKIPPMPEGKRALTSADRDSLRRNPRYQEVINREVWSFEAVHEDLVSVDPTMMHYRSLSGGLEGILRLAHAHTENNYREWTKYIRETNTYPSEIDIEGYWMILSQQPRDATDRPTTEDQTPDYRLDIYAIQVTATTEDGRTIRF